MSMEKKHNTFRFCIQALLFASPIIVVLGMYVVLDPFRVVRHHEDISADSFLPLNKDFASTEIYLRNAPTEQFNSFLLGSSRTMAYRLDTWKKQLPNTAKPFAFDASKETLWGIEKKLELLDSLKAPINDVLIIIDPLNTFAPMRNSTGHLFIKDPRVSGESKFTFEKTFLEAWFADLFFVKYIDYACFGKVRPYMEGVLAIDENNLMDPITAERNMGIERYIVSNPDSFYTARAAIFYVRDTTQQKNYPPMITADHVRALDSIHRITEKNNARLEVVISPGYDLAAIDATDLAALQHAFGTKHVHDYSGINSITKDIHNYIESSHYRQHVGAQIMQEIYDDDERTQK